MTRLDRFLAYAETHRLSVRAMAAAAVAVIAWVDWVASDLSIGFLYLVPILFSAAALTRVQILSLAVLCAYLRELLDPVQGAPGAGLSMFLGALNPLHWAPGSEGRLLVAASGFAMTGFFVAELNRHRAMLRRHLYERDEQIRARQEAELRVRILIDTTPLAMLTLNHEGKVDLANDSALQVLGFKGEALPEKTLLGREIGPHLPILARMLNSHRGGGNIRTNVECKAQRCNGEIFLAHVWLSTYRTSGGPGLAAVIWDASENLRDREGAGLDSMMATSRVLIGALSHEIRNLASAAASAHFALGESGGFPRNDAYHALGTLIRGLEKIASTGLQMASGRENAVADLATVLDETRIVIEPALREAGVELVWQVGSELPLVQGDHHSLLQAFLNLTRNSEQALEHSARRQLKISAEVESDLVIVRFRDTGPGVAHPEELFRPFQPGAHHSGLGLYISRAILRSYGGGLRYEPQPEGSCFAVELWPMENGIDTSCNNR